MTGEAAPRVGLVAIGRNEGDRLERCLRSAAGSVRAIVYVDSGSVDGSVQLARDLGAGVVELDMRTPFTAARARNAGFRSLQSSHPDLEYVQFVDGDCEIVNGWIDTAAEWLDRRADIALVCGRRRERYPERSVYNLLCDIEWDTPVGEAKECGGDILIRAAAFRAIDGFREDLIAGEEPELCIRLRAAGWRIWRIDAEMTLHDAAITRFWQWWLRSMRSGYAAAQGVDLHGGTRERHRVAISRSIWLWGLLIPAATLAGITVWGPLAFAMLLAYPAQVARVAARQVRSRRERWWYAAFLVLGKFPELVGQLKFLSHRLVGGRARLIEYK